MRQKPYTPDTAGLCDWDIHLNPKSGGAHTNLQNRVEDILINLHCLSSSQCEKVLGPGVEEDGDIVTTHKYIHR